MNDSSHDRRRRLFRAGLGLILVTYLALAGIRCLAPDDLGMRDQQDPASYIVDVVQNGNWLCPRDAHGAITSKPPMHPWIAAIASHALGGVARPAWLFPSLLSMLVAALTIYVAGRRSIGWEAALLAAMMFLLSHLTPKMLGIVRTDALFACVVLLNALAAYRVWERGKGWTLFWVIALVNTLIKGPLGVILALSGLLAVIWERRRGHPTPFGRAMISGFLFWAAAIATWLLISWRVYGDEVINEMIGRELLRHATTGDGGELAILRFYQAPLYLLTRFAPWSLLTITGIVRVFRNPAPEDARRRFDRFSVCWILAGLVIFSFAGHQRPDLIFPLFPPAAWLAGGVMTELRWFRGPRRAFVTACLLATLLVPVIAVVYTLHYPKHPGVQLSLATKRLADELRATVGPEFPLAFAGAPLALQIHLGIWRRTTTHQVACDLLEGNDPAFVAVRFVDRFMDDCPGSRNTVRIFHRWEAGGSKHAVAVLGNRDRLDWYDTMSGWMAPFKFTYRDLRPLGGKSHYLDRSDRQVNGGRFRVGIDGGRFSVRNSSDRPAMLRLDLQQGGRHWREQHAVVAGGELSLSWPPLDSDPGG